MSQEYPRFAVVGHPNKGKSSIVSTLAHDESVHISTLPGTTTKQRSYPLKIDGVTLYALFDTPGFQRARAILSWLKKEETPAHKRVDRVKKFIYEHRENPRYQDEIELLEPIINGAGIIYVVDGSKPYGVEYEAEMQILLWTGQPSMALINLIDTTDYVSEWRMALGQHFQMVRLFNPMKANFAQHITLLESMAQLNEEWTTLVKQSIDIFKLYHQQKITHSSEIITNLIIDSLSLTLSSSIKGLHATKVQEKEIIQEYKQKLRITEENAHHTLAKVWNHLLLEKSSQVLLLENIDLFSKESETLFGLRKKELIATGLAGGALTGSGIDLMLAGSSLMLGSAVGAIIGGAGILFSYGEIAQFKILGHKIGQKHIQIGPIQHANFPYILLKRVLFYTQEIANRPHANRSKITMDSSLIQKEFTLNNESKKTLEKMHKTLQEGNTPKQKLIEEYTQTISQILLARME